MADYVAKIREANEVARKATEERDAAVAELKVTKSRTPASRHYDASAPYTAPHVTTGPIGQDSRGFRLCKAIAAQRGLIEPSEAKEEIEACNQFAKALTEANWLPQEVTRKSLMIPLSSEHLSEEVVNHKGHRVFKAMWAAGTEGFDPGEVEYMVRKGVVRKTAMSYLLDTTGGTLVAPPVQGELIELVRPQEALQRAGVTRYPLPPNGRITFPRQTGATTMYFVGENVAITESNPTTGQVSLQAKKGGVLTRVPNELLKYAGVAADALIRTDMSKTIALGMDNAGLYGTGGSAQPKGLSLYTGSNEVIDYKGVTPAPKGIGAQGNVLRPEDGYRMIGLVEDRNFEFKGWIFRPTMANNVIGYRADAAAPADAAGGFVQGLMRAVSDRMPGDNWAGFPVVKSSIIRNTRAKGAATNLTEVFGGQWEHLLHGLYGAIEIASSTESDDAFKQDQTVVRSLVHFDFAPRYEGAFVWYDLLVNSTN